MAAAVGKKLQRTVAGDNGAVEWFLMQLPRTIAIDLISAQSLPFKVFQK